jgi:hypothetical protein
MDIVLRGAAWTNPGDPLDVDGSGVVVPLDVLLIFNELNSRQLSAADGSLPLVPPSTGTSKRFLDTNGDSFATPQDALVIINYLNKPAGEGESSDREIYVIWADEAWVSTLVVAPRPRGEPPSLRRTPPQQPLSTPGNLALPPGGRLSSIEWQQTDNDQSIASCVPRQVERSLEMILDEEGVAVAAHFCLDWDWGIP